MTSSTVALNGDAPEREPVPTLTSLAGVAGTAPALPVATATTVPPPPPPATGLEATTRTAQMLLKLIGWTLCGCIVLVTITLCYRVWVDGDAPRTIAITDALLQVFPWMLGTMALSILGVKSVPEIVQAMLARGAVPAASLPTGGHS